MDKSKRQRVSEIADPLYLPTKFRVSLFSHYAG
jgi:hypothetical protein